MDEDGRGCGRPRANPVTHTHPTTRPPVCLSAPAPQLREALSAPHPERLQFVLGTEAGMITSIVRKVQGLLRQVRPRRGGGGRRHTGSGGTRPCCLSPRPHPCLPPLNRSCVRYTMFSTLPACPRPTYPSSPSPCIGFGLVWAGIYNPLPPPAPPAPSAPLQSGRTDVEVEVVFPVAPSAVATPQQRPQEGAAPLTLPTGLALVPGESAAAAAAERIASELRACVCGGGATQAKPS